jgi:phosphatidylglycerophosphate synthase
MNASNTAVVRQPREFRESQRVLTSFLAAIEKRCLVWMAARMPPWINSDHLTALALVAMIGCGASYWLARFHPIGIWLAIACLAMNWFGDSLDGTLARVRQQQRPRYGFYVDHVVDVFGATALFCGLALSGYMTPVVALVLLSTYLLVCIETYLATYCLGTFRISFFKMGPTELRILLAAGTLALRSHPTVMLFDRPYQLFDVGGVIGSAALLVTAAISAARNGAQLYREEPLRGK